MATDEFVADAKWVRIVPLQITKKGETRFASEAMRGIAVDCEESGTRLASANLRARGKVVLKMKEKLCGKVEKTRRRIICTKR